ncbi:hypothetical protein ACHQM5_014525 [Ranunculus cassubicifolius]
MEETREVAMAYYSNSSEETKKLAKDFFHDMDKDQDGKISIKEFDEFLKEKSPRLKSVLFSEIDKDGDGFLDFEEVILFYYIAKFRRFWCDVCKTSLQGVFFTCSECFLKGSYDLCLPCYQTMKFQHEHKVFLDNYVMLDLAQNELSKKKMGDEKKEVFLVGLVDLLGLLLGLKVLRETIMEETR